MKFSVEPAEGEMAVIRSSGPKFGAFDWAGLSIGFGLGGFFDGILLHQILQWHHLLSGIAATRQDVRLLILGDGIFHALMYVITGVGVWLLWRMRSRWNVSGADRRLLADVFTGFGVWHVVDAILSHWVLGIHRIRMDVDNPLVWDVAWLAIFGLGPLIAAWVLRRGSGLAANGSSTSLALIFTAILAGSVAAVPPTDDGTVVILYRPDVAPSQAFGAMLSAGGRLLWTDASEQVWVVKLPAGADRNAFYRYGALLVSGARFSGGCVSYVSA